MVRNLLRVIKLVVRLQILELFLCKLLLITVQYKQVYFMHVQKICFMQTLKLYDNIKLANSYGFSKIEKSSLCVISLAKLNIQIMSFIFKDKCTISITWKLLQGTWKLKILKHVFNIYSVQDYRYKLVSLYFASFKCKCGNYSNPYLSGFNGSW